MGKLAVISSLRHQDLGFAFRALPIHPDFREAAEVALTDVHATTSLKDSMAKGTLSTYDTLTNKFHVAILAPTGSYDASGKDEHSFSSDLVFWQVWEDWIKSELTDTYERSTVITSKVAGGNFDRDLVKAVSAHANWYRSALAVLQGSGDIGETARAVVGARFIKKDMAVVGVMLEIDEEHFTSTFPVEEVSVETIRA